MIDAVLIDDDKDKTTTHIIGTYQLLMQHTLCGWVDVKHEYIKAEKITCKTCIAVLQYTRGLKKGRDY